MADLSITAANVQSGADSSVRRGVAGETIAAGKAVYLDSASKSWKLADSNSATAEARKAGGLALHGAAAGQPLAVQTGGEIALGSVLTPGVAYYLSDTPGGICPIADVGTGEYVCLIGLAKSATTLAIDVQFPGVAN